MDSPLPSLRNTMNGALTTTLYRPKLRKPLELLPSFHRYAFQERETEGRREPFVPATKHRFNEATNISVDSTTQDNGTADRVSSTSPGDNQDGYSPNSMRGTAPKVFRPRMSERVAALCHAPKVNCQCEPSSTNGHDVKPVFNLGHSGSEEVSAAEDPVLASALASLEEDEDTVRRMIHQRRARFLLKEERTATAPLDDALDDPNPNGRAVRSLFRQHRKERLDSDSFSTTEATSVLQRNAAHAMFSTGPPPSNPNPAPQAEFSAGKPLIRLSLDSANRQQVFERGTVLPEPLPSPAVATGTEVPRKPCSYGVPPTATAQHPLYETTVRNDIVTRVTELLSEFAYKAFPQNLEDAIDAGAMQTMELLRWVLYEEMYERQLIQNEEENRCPIPWCSSGSLVIQQDGSRIVHLHDLPFSETADLEARITQSVDAAVARFRVCAEEGPLEVYHGETAEGGEGTPSVSELILTIVAGVTAEKEEILTEALQHHRVLDDMWHLFVDEKAQRVALLGKFVSCEIPQPCRCLLWDWEILEESAIPLAPRVDVICLFVSTVVGNYEIVQDAILAEHQRTLDVLLPKMNEGFIAQYVYERYCEDEDKEWSRLMEYHSYCMTEAASRGCEDATLWVAKHIEEPMLYPRLHCGPNEPTLSPTLYERPPPILGSMDSPFCTYHNFMELASTVKSLLRNRGRVGEAEGCERKRLEGTLNTRWRTLEMVDNRQQGHEQLVAEEHKTWCQLMRVFNRGARSIARDQYEQVESDVALLIHQLSVEQLSHQAEVSMASLEDQYFEEWRKISLVECEQRRWREVDARKKLSVSESAALARRWILEDNLVYAQGEENRLRERILAEEQAVWSTVEAEVRWFTMEFYVSYSRIVMSHRDAMSIFSLELDEVLAREEIIQRRFEEHEGLFQRIQLKPVSHLAVEPGDDAATELARELINHKDFDLRWLLVSNLNDFLEVETILHIFT